MVAHRPEFGQFSKDSKYQADRQSTTVCWCRFGLDIHVVEGRDKWKNYQDALETVDQDRRYHRCRLGLGIGGRDRKERRGRRKEEEGAKSCLHSM